MITTDLPSADQRRAVEALLDRVHEHDGVTPLDEAARLALRAASPRPGVLHLLLPGPGGEMLGYASVLADGTAQGMVRPEARRRGHGTALLTRVLAARPDARVWAHGALDGALSFLGERGMVPARTLLTLHRSLEEEIPQRAARAEGVEVSTFEGPRDAAQLLAVNAAAFADHPEQRALDEQGLAERMAEPWFDPRGLHVARRDGRLLAFVWTKWEPGAATAEIYVVGTAPAAQGTGIGGMLLRRALADLRERGARAADLFVEADNGAALGLYERLGFTVLARDVQFRAAGAGGTPSDPSRRGALDAPTASSRAADTGLIGGTGGARQGDARRARPESPREGRGPGDDDHLPGLPADRFLERELSWLAFNERVQELSADADTPLLERAGFSAIFSANLDEFFMVRVAGLKRRLETGIAVAGASGMPPRQVLERVRRRAHELQVQQARIVQHGILPELEARAGIRILGWDQLARAEKEALTGYFAAEVFPVLTPLAVDPAHPFPYISGLSLNLVVTMRPEPVEPVEPPGEDAAQAVRYARLKVPDALPRLVRVHDVAGAPDGAEGARFVPLEDVVAANLGQLFPGMEILGHHLFRVTRNEDLEVEEDDAENLLDALEKEILRRRFGAPVRLEVEEGIDPDVRDWLVRELGVMGAEVFELPGLLDLRVLEEIAGLDIPSLRFTPFLPATHHHLNQVETARPADVLGAIRSRDILLHHPYDSFSTSVQAFLEQAAADPDVLAIKQTLYRTSGDSPIVDALIDAAEAGKQVLALVEIKARFDEQANISWARKLEHAGVHVVYGIVGLKTHAKLSMVVRREKSGLRRYCHVGTGNYHPRTARRYEDLGLLTCDPHVGEDLARLFNQLSGYAPRTDFERLLVAPRFVRSGLIELIEQEMEHHQAGRPARIRLKGNSMVDEQIIDALYRASRAGVPVDIVVRGICALRPGVSGLSETIRVRSILGRFLEHSRIFAFEGGGSPVVLIGSADMMHRNLDRRVEALVRITAPDHQEELVRLMDLEMDDATSSWHLEADGTWTRHSRDASGEPLRDAQEELIARHRRRRRLA